jgi:hypothetical protein
MLYYQKRNRGYSTIRIGTEDAPLSEQEQRMLHYQNWNRGCSTIRIGTEDAPLSEYEQRIVLFT